MNSISKILSKFENNESGIKLDMLSNEIKSIKNRTEDVSLHEVKELVNFCADQIGYWRTEYFFSSANAPNHDAEKEMSGWEKLWENWLEMLSEKVPDVTEQLMQIKTQISMRHTLERKLEYNKNGILRQPISTFLSNIAIFLNKIGLKGIAVSLYTTILYPKGSVGRIC